MLFATYVPYAQRVPISAVWYAYTARHPIRLQLIDLERFDEVKLLHRAAQKMKCTIIMVNAGWIVNGLIIARPGTNRPLWNRIGRSSMQHIHVLESDEELMSLEGENCTFDMTRVTGKVTLVTSKRRIGPFGHSAKYTHTVPSQQGIVYEKFNVPIDRVKLKVDPDRSIYLGPIE